MGAAPPHTMSLTHMATQSMPTVSCLSIRKASFSLVPTPSVPETSTGRLTPVRSGSNKPPNPPMPDRTPGTAVRATCFFISSTAL